MQKMSKLAKFVWAFILCLLLTILNNYTVHAQSNVYDTGNYTKSGDVIYYVKPDGWSESIPNIYAWNDSNTLNSWPGNQMTLVEGNLYKYEFTDNTGYSKIIFSDGSDTSSKTNTLEFICSEYVYEDNLIAYTQKD